MDGLVCAAATLGKGDVEHTTAAVWREVMRLNVDAVWECCRRLFLMSTATGVERRIVTLGSLSGIYATEKFAGMAAYNSSKFAVIGLTEAVAVEGRDLGISAVCGAPVPWRPRCSTRPTLTWCRVCRLPTPVVSSQSCLTEPVSPR